ncbi:MAG: ABC transporter permease [Pseudomonadota bacterium]
MSVATNTIGFMTIVRKEYSRIMRIWVQTIVPPVITVSMYFIIFGTLIGERIGPMAGFDYMQYIAPGLIMMSVINNSFGNVVSSFFGAKFGKHIEEMLVSPMPNWLIILGHVSGGVLRGLLVGALVTVIALLFTNLSVVNLPVTIAVVLLTAVVFSLGGLINAIFAKDFEGISIIPTFVLAPLTYLGGVFYSVDLLPSPWQEISRVNPILYMVNAFRYGILGESDVSIGTAFTIIIVFALALYAIAIHLMRKGTGMRS